MFYKHDKHFCTCTDPKNRRYQSDGATPVGTTLQIPFYKQLASYFASKKSRDLLLYRSKRESSPRDGQMKDIFDGAIYQKNKSLFRNELDLALALYIDGINPQKKGSTSMVTFMAVILNNLPPDIRSVCVTFIEFGQRIVTDNQFGIIHHHRYLKENLLQVFVTCGEKKPKNIFGYMAPTLKSLMTLQKCGMVITTAQNESFSVKAFVLAVIGDFPAMAELTLHKTHASVHGCRICTVIGKKSSGRRGFSFVGSSEETAGVLRKKKDFQVSEVVYPWIVE